MKFYQIHVPKTGGSTLHTYSRQHKLNWISQKHWYWSQRSIPNDSIVITSLRCPIRQTISMYSYWNNGGTTNPAKGTWQWWALQVPFSEWIKKCRLSHDSPNSNLYVVFFGDVKNAGLDNVIGDFDTAVAHLKTVHHILDTTHLTEQFNERVARKYKLPQLSLHTNKSPPLKITSDDMKHIRERRAKDFELCKMFGIKSDYY